jgi:outer membrane protein assembly factor BamB
METEMTGRWRAIHFAWVIVVACAGADWRAFRGSDGSGVAPDQILPVKWTTTENVAWTAALPGRGLSSPIIVGRRVFVTCSSGPDQDRLHVIAFDAETGKEVWHRQFWATGRTMCHPKTCVAAPTPTSDGAKIYCLFSTNDLVSLELSGELCWFRGLTHDYPNASNSLGMASSPVVVGNTLIVQVECDSRASFAAGIDVETGVSRWKLPRPTMANWTTPCVVRGKNRQPDFVLLQSGRGLSAHDPSTGVEVFNYDEGADTISSSSVVGNFVYVPSHGVTVLAIDSGASSFSKSWRSNRLRPATSSLVVYRDRVFTLNGGVLSCGDAAGGKLLWQLRLQGDFSASLVAAGGHIYCFNEQGVGQVVTATQSDGRLVGGGDLGETILATPAIANGALYVRSDRRLWKIGGLRSSAAGE